MKNNIFYLLMIIAVCNGCQAKRDSFERQKGIGVILSNKENHTDILVGTQHEGDKGEHEIFIKPDEGFGSVHGSEGSSIGVGSNINNKTQSFSTSGTSGGDSQSIGGTGIIGNNSGTYSYTASIGNGSSSYSYTSTSSDPSNFTFFMPPPITSYFGGNNAPPQAGNNPFPPFFNPYMWGGPTTYINFDDDEA